MREFDTSRQIKGNQVLLSPSSLCSCVPEEVVLSFCSSCSASSDIVQGFVVTVLGEFRRIRIVVRLASSNYHLE